MSDTDKTEVDEEPVEELEVELNLKETTTPAGLTPLAESEPLDIEEAEKDLDQPGPDDPLYSVLRSAYPDASDDDLKSRIKDLGQTKTTSPNEVLNNLVRQQDELLERNNVDGLMEDLYRGHQAILRNQTTGYDGPWTIQDIVIKHTKAHNTTPDQLRADMEGVGLSYEYMVEQIGRKGVQPDAMKDNLRSRGASVYDSSTARAADLKREIGIVNRESEAMTKALDEGKDEALIAQVTPRFVDVGDISQRELTALQAQVGDRGFAKAQALLAGVLADEELGPQLESYARLTGEHSNAYALETANILINRDGLERGTPEYKERYDFHYQRAIQFIAAARMMGIWQGSALVERHILNPGDETWGEALSPKVEVVGFNANGEVLIRGEDLLSAVFAPFDVGEQSLVGLARAAKAGKLTSWEDTTDAMRTANADRASIIGFYGEWVVLNPDTVNTYEAWGVGLVAMWATVLIPDTFSAAGWTNKLVSMPVMKTMDFIKLNEARKILDAAALARKEQRWQDLPPLMQKFRKKYPELSDALDAHEAKVAERYAREVPEILGEAGAELARRTPGGPGARQLNLHPSRRRRELSPSRPGLAPGAEKKPPFTQYKDLYDTEAHLAAIAETRKQLKSGSLSPQVSKSRPQISGNIRNAEKTLAEAGASADDIRDFRKFIDDSLQKGITDPKAWTNSVMDYLRNQNVVRRILDEDIARYPAKAQKALKNKQKINAKLRRKLYRELFIGKKSARAKLTKIADETTTLDEALSILDDVKRAVLVNDEIRIVALLQVSATLSGRMGRKPKLPKAELGNYRDVRELDPLHELSRDAINFMDEVIKKFDMPKDDALAVTRIYEAIAKAWGAAEGRKTPEWWAQTIAGVKRADVTAGRNAVARLGRVKKAKGKAEEFGEILFQDSMQNLWVTGGGKAVRRALQSHWADIPGAAAPLAGSLHRPGKAGGAKKIGDDVVVRAALADSAERINKAVDREVEKLRASNTHEDLTEAEISRFRTQVEDKMANDIVSKLRGDMEDYSRARGAVDDWMSSDYGGDMGDVKYLDQIELMEEASQDLRAAGKYFPSATVDGSVCLMLLKHRRKRSRVSLTRLLFEPRRPWRVAGILPETCGVEVHRRSVSAWRWSGISDGWTLSMQISESLRSSSTCLAAISSTTWLWVSRAPGRISQAAGFSWVFMTSPTMSSS